MGHYTQGTLLSQKTSISIKLPGCSSFLHSTFHYQSKMLRAVLEMDVSIFLQNLTRTEVLH